MIDLFSTPVSDKCSPIYKNMRTEVERAESVTGIAARENCQKLWLEYQKFADENFVTEFAKQTHNRWFEMYLAVS